MPDFILRFYVSWKYQTPLSQKIFIYILLFIDLSFAIASFKIWNK